MRLVPIGPLPERAVDAAAEFYARVVPMIDLRAPDAEEDHVVLLFDPAPYDHLGWRLAAVRDLARAAAPMRVNGLAGDDEAAVAETLAFVSAAPGITGQLLAVDGKSGETR